MGKNFKHYREFQIRLTMLLKCKDEVWKFQRKKITKEILKYFCCFIVILVSGVFNFCGLDKKSRRENFLCSFHSVESNEFSEKTNVWKCFNRHRDNSKIFAFINNSVQGEYFFTVYSLDAYMVVTRNFVVQ